MLELLESPLKMVQPKGVFFAKLNYNYTGLLFGLIISRDQ